MATMNGQWLLRERPTGRVGQHNFSWVEQALPDLADGEALVRTRFLSLDPTQRIWMTEQKQYMPPVALGEVMRGGAVVEVVQSRSDAWKPGDLAMALTGWQQYGVLGPHAQAMKLPVEPRLPLEVYLGAAGMTGMTAYFGMLDIGQPQAGQTVVVSAAAGAVGSVAGQIAKLCGCRVVGIAGGVDKCAWLTETLHFDAAIDYKRGDVGAQLDAACPDGIDIDFENVGGSIMEAVLGRMRLHGRVILCGLISGYNDAAPLRVDLSQMLMQRLHVQGMIILDYASRFGEAARALGQWLAAGKIVHRETVVDGLRQAPDHLNMLFDGHNTGKLVVRVS